MGVEEEEKGETNNDVHQEWDTVDDDNVGGCNGMVAVGTIIVILLDDDDDMVVV